MRQRRSPARAAWLTILTWETTTAIAVVLLLWVDDVSVALFVWLVGTIMIILTMAISLATSARRPFDGSVWLPLRIAVGLGVLALVFAKLLELSGVAFALLVAACVAVTWSLIRVMRVLQAAPR